MSIHTTVRAGEGSGLDPYGLPTEGDAAMSIHTTLRAADGNGLDPHGG